MSLDIIILAAGQGTRMRSSLPKVLHPVAGRSMVGHVVHTAQQLTPTSIQVVIGHGAQKVREHFADQSISFAVQEQQLGTGHAVAQALPNLTAERVLILYGDVPLITKDTLLGLLAKVQPKQIGLLTVLLDDPTGYGRIVRDSDGKVQAIVEHKDANDAQRLIKEGNTGILAVPRACLVEWLGKLSNNNAQGEYYLTDIIAMAVADGFTVATEIAQDAIEVQGANDRLQLSELERHYQYRSALALMKQGVTLRDPARFDIRGEVIVGKDVLIDVNVILEGSVLIEDNVHIGANCYIKDSVLRNGAIIKANSYLEGAEVGNAADCGPFARLRQGAILGAQAHVGNFVELKNTRLGEGAKAGHLAYLGDSDIGARTNIGAGTITCNYDGANKHKTVMAEDVFIGSNSSLVAPVNLGAGATTGAGSTITGDVPAGALAVGRARQRNIENWQRPVKKK
ncbi:bifunctional UDP-N-acetylglucosamine diphosphorylase/glucosamine-1-phosphate N-acetyltransferase GlmU [Pseudomonas sp. F1_0610]|uniref:bifunctional UDP-N-acetylglucosamine diphosphorylase/glucosamine-1-phosphate N-acetyltransferase GlmU n=1 Tax=Pseudomonas sp. F1_0610 TaxID=3114284 RepID=UPI0039C35770